MAHELKPFSALIPNWPDHAPSDGADLILADDDTLAALGLEGSDLDLVTEMRRHLRSAALARGSSTQLSNANAVVAAFDAGDLRVYHGKWFLLVLDKHRRRVFAQQNRDSGTSRTVARLSKWVPDESSKLPGLPEDGAYLLLWGGTADILAIEDVRARLRWLGENYPIVDVVFRSRGRKARAGDDSTPTDTAPTTWSLREGIGVRSGEAVPFPESTHHEEVNLWE